MAIINHPAPSAGDFARMEGELFTRIERKHNRQVRRHRLVVAVAVVAIAGGGIAAGTVANPAQQSAYAVCYSGASTGSQSAQAVYPDRSGEHASNGARPSAAKVATAVSLCGQIWRIGVFSGTSTKTVKVPKLQACLRDDLVITVFPKGRSKISASAFCNNVGMSKP